MPKPDPDLEAFFAGDFADRQDALAGVLLLAAIILVVIACVFTRA